MEPSCQPERRFGKCRVRWKRVKVIFHFQFAASFVTEDSAFAKPKPSPADRCIALAVTQWPQKIYLVSRRAQPKPKAASAEAEVQHDAHSLAGRLHQAESQAPSEGWRSEE